MTNREVMQMALDALERYQVKRMDFDRFADEIAALREALAQPDTPEPVVPIHQWRKRGGLWTDSSKEEAYSRIDDCYEGRTLYLAPPAPSDVEGWKWVPLKQTKEMSDAGEVIAREMLDANISKTMGSLGGHVVKDKYSQIATDYANGLINSVDGIYQTMVIAAPDTFKLEPIMWEFLDDRGKPQITESKYVAEAFNARPVGWKEPNVTRKVHRKPRWYKET